MKLPRLLVLAAVVAAFVPTSASAGVPEGADWTEVYIEGDGVTLHADVLRPKGYTDAQKTPVILAIGPYFAHSGSLPTPPDFNPVSEQNRPSARFNDMIEGGKVFERGYTVVYVDLRGFGASTGCNDFGGPGEQADAKAAVEWAASQPWSNGKVGMWGKSYDAWTQVMALDEKPKGLAAAVIQAPIIDGYRTLYQNGVHYDAGWYATPALYQSIDAMPPTVFDNPEYFLGSAMGNNPACYAQNVALQNSTVDWGSQFWKDRNLDNARGSDVAVLWSHGFLDANTKPDNFLSVWETLKGPSRAWFGQYDHVRGNESNVVGREGFLDEAMRWFDRYLKGDAGAKVEDDPRVEVQDNEGKWRGEAQWPPADAGLRLMPLKSGTVTDAANNTGEGDATAPAAGPTGVGVWSVSQPLEHDARMAGVAKVTLDVSTASPRAHVYALLYDVDLEAGTAMIISRAAHVVTSADKQLSFDLYPEDWKLAAGHRVGVLIAGSDLDWYNPPHSGQQVEITGGGMQIPFLRFDRTQFLEGDQAAAFGNRQAITFDPAWAEEGSVVADLPPALAPMPVGGLPVGPGPAAKPKAARLRLSTRARGRRLTVTVRGGGSRRVTVVVRLGRKVIARRGVRARRGVAKTTFRLRRRGTYRVTASVRGAGAPRAATRRLRVR